MPRFLPGNPHERVSRPISQDTGGREPAGREAVVQQWLGALEARYMADLTLAEVARAVRALSSTYVERRSALARGAALDSAGKRAAFALFYAPLHFAVVQAIVRRLGAGRRMPRTLLDLGCGTGVAGAAWALEAAPRPRLVGIDRHPWAAAEAEWTWRTLGLRGRALQGDAVRARWGTPPPAVVAGYLVNELAGDRRRVLLERLIDLSARGGRLLVIEPIAKRAAPWWQEWSEAFEATGGRADEWTIAPDLPAHVRQLARAAGLDRDEVKARSLYRGPEEPSHCT